MSVKKIKQALSIAFLLIPIFVWSMSSAVASDVHPKHLRFGVLPLQSPTKLASMFLPLAGYLTDQLGKPVQFVTSPNFSTFMARVEKGEYDLIYHNPMLYRRSRTYGYRAIVSVAGEPFTGILVVRKDGRIKSLANDLLPKDVRIGFPDPDAFAATVMTKQYLETLGIEADKRMQVQYFGSQDSALLALYSGLVDIIGTWRPSLRSMPKDIQDKLTIIAETPPQPQMPIAVINTMPDSERELLRSALAELHHHKDGERILRRMGFKQGFAKINDRAYMDVTE